MLLTYERRSVCPLVPMLRQIFLSANFISCCLHRPSFNPFDCRVNLLQFGSYLLCLRSEVKLISDQALVNDLFLCLLGSL